MEHTVPLAELPAGMALPRDLADSFGYDAARRCLFYRGFMSKALFDRLIQLHESWTYRRAIEELFRLSTAEDPAPRKPGALRRMAGLLHLTRP
jgi:hypothetical protein